MSVRIICQGCGKKIDVPDDYPRNKYRCPGCGVYCDLRDVRKGTPATKPAEPPAGVLSPYADPSPDSPFLVQQEPQRPVAVPAAVAVPAPLPPANLSDEDDDSPYAMRPEAPKCPGCRKEWPANVAVCPTCGYDPRTGKQPVKSFAPVSRTWEPGWAYPKRLTLFFVLQGVFAFMGIVFLTTVGSWGALLFSWAVFTFLLSFSLGTFFRIDLNRDRRGKVTLTRTWRVCMIPRRAEKIDWRRYEGVMTGKWYEPDLADYGILICLLLMCLVPGLIWYFTVFYKETYHVALTKDHGHPAVSLFQGMDGDEVNDLAQTLREVTDLPLAT